MSLPFEICASLLANLLGQVRGGAYQSWQVFLGFQA